MVSTAHSAYIVPENYLNPPSSSFDAGASPLALLEKTCQSVGHDPLPKAGSLAASGDSPAKKDGGSQSSPAKAKSPDGAHGKAKPPLASPASKSDRSSSVSGHKTDENGNKTKDGADSASRKAGGSRPTSAPTEPGSGTSQPIPPSLPSLPTPSAARPPLPAFPSYPGFPHPFPGGFPHAAFPFPGGFASPYAGLSSLSAGFPRPPMPCLDINCKTCPPSVAGTGALHCPPVSGPDLSALWLNCYSSFLPPPGGLGFPGAGLPHFPSTSAAAAAAAAAANPALPHFCSWVTPDGLCSKRFASSDELLQHVRTHTSSTGDSAASSSASTSSTTTSAASSASSSSSAPSSSAGSLSRPNPMLGLPSPLGSSAGGRMSPRSAYMAMARYHPYSKPGGMGMGMGPGGMGSGLPSGLGGGMPPPFGSPFAGYPGLSALYAARLPSSLPHP